MFKKLWLKIKGLFLVVFGGAKKFEQFLKDHADDAISIVENIKKFVESDTVITLISLFPKYEARAKEWLDKAQVIIDQILAGLDEGKVCMAEPIFVNRLKCVVDLLRRKPQVQREEFYRAVSAKYLQLHSIDYTKDKSAISDTVALTIVQNQYAAKKAEQKGIKPAKTV